MILSSVYGGEVAPLAIETTTGFTTASLDRLSEWCEPCLQLLSELLADSWVTIGIDSQAEGDEVDISTIEAPNQPGSMRLLMARLFQVRMSTSMTRQAECVRVEQYAEWIARL